VADPVTSFTGMAVMALVALAAFAVILVAGRRRDDGPGRAGALPVYLAAVMLVMLVVAVVAVGVAASALVRLGLEPSGARAAPVPIRPGQLSPTPATGSPTAQLVGAAVTAVLAGGLFELHRRRLHRMTEAEGRGGPGSSVHRSYAAAVSLAAAVLVVVSGGQAALGATRAIAPGDAGDRAPPRRTPPGAAAAPAVQPERDAGAVQVLGNGVVFALAAGVWVYHWRRIDEAPAPDEPATMGP
jgi:hypothetical protein